MSCASGGQALTLGRICLGICLANQPLLEFLPYHWLSDLEMNWDG